jgi:hypothetical protein
MVGNFLAVGMPAVKRFPERQAVIAQVAILAQTKNQPALPAVRGAAFGDVGISIGQVDHVAFSLKSVIPCLGSAVERMNSGFLFLVLVSRGLIRPAS